MKAATDIATASPEVTGGQGGYGYGRRDRRDCRDSRRGHGQILYQDDFSDKKSGWPENNTNFSLDYYTNYSGGEYYMRAIANYGNLTVHLGKDFTDASVQVEAKMEDGTNVTTYGLLCRVQNDSDYYYFMVSGGGSYLIGKHLGVKNFTLTDWTPLPRDVRSRNGYIITLRGDCQGSTLTFYANGKLLASVSDTTFAHGDVGLIISPASSTSLYVYFDNFIVRKP